MQLLKYKYRIYPNNEQLSKLNQIAGAQRYIWNYYLDLNVMTYQSHNQFVFHYDMNKDLTMLKKTTKWLKDMPSTSLQQTLGYLDKSLKASFNKNIASSARGFPRFKNRKSNKSFTLTMVNSNRNFKANGFYLPKVGTVKIKYHRSLPNDFKSCQVKQEADGWYLVLTTKKAKIMKRPKVNACGIDLNSKEFVLFDGSIELRYEIPKPLRENQTKLKIFQRQMTRKQKGSNNWWKVVNRLRLLHQKIARIRSDFFHKLSFLIAKSYDLISIEDLDVKGIQKKLGKVIGDNAFGGFRQMLEYKAELYGSTISVIDRYFPSSQTCSSCGSIKKMPLSERNYSCRCGLNLDRDLNSAINIKRAGTARIASGDNSFEDQAVMFGILNGLSMNEEATRA